MKHERAPAMVDYVSRIYRTSELYKAHNDVKADEINQQREIIDDLMLQMTPQTATWAIKYWEEMCGLPIQRSESIELRRMKVLAHLARKGPMTQVRLENILYKGTGAVVDIVFTNIPGVMGAIITEFHQLYDVRLVMAMIEDIAPCHLEWRYIVRFSMEFEGYDYSASACAQHIQDIFIEDNPCYSFVGEIYYASGISQHISECFIEGSEDAWSTNTFEASAIANVLIKEVFNE